MAVTRKVCSLGGYLTETPSLSPSSSSDYSTTSCCHPNGSRNSFSRRFEFIPAPFMITRLDSYLIPIIIIVHFRD